SRTTCRPQRELHSLLLARLPVTYVVKDNPSCEIVKLCILNFGKISGLSRLSRFPCKYTKLEKKQKRVAKGNLRCKSMTQSAQCRERLASQQGADGAWGYAESGPGQVEPTSLALLALQQDQNQFRQVIERGLACLSRLQSADGAWRLCHGDGTAV